MLSLFPSPAFQQFQIPEEEAEWVGLSLEEAVEKQRQLEHKVTRHPTVTIWLWRFLRILLEKTRRKKEKTFTEMFFIITYYADC